MNPARKIHDATTPPGVERVVTPFDRRILSHGDRSLLCRFVALIRERQLELVLGVGSCAAGQMLRRRNRALHSDRHVNVITVLLIRAGFDFQSHRACFVAAGTLATVGHNPLELCIEVLRHIIIEVMQLREIERK